MLNIRLEDLYIHSGHLIEDFSSDFLIDQSSKLPVEHATPTGTSGNDTLVGTAGDDTLDGGAGADKMFGGLGNDTYMVDNVNDVVIDKLRAGTDTILSSVTYTASAHIENLSLIGSGNINAFGNKLNNVLTGNSGNNFLDGGSGSDTLVGGLGNDTYVVDKPGDQIFEAAGEGIDAVNARISWTLGANLENLSLEGTANLNGSGNALNNTLMGNAGDNVLNGGDGDDSLVGDSGDDTLNGGLGADTMKGGSGNDSYVINKLGDKVFENPGDGIDTVISSLNYQLGANVENLVLDGSADLNGSGNSLNNKITGNSGNNILDGGSGNDTLSGGLGGDTYILDSANDLVVEKQGEGTDTVQASFSYVLGSDLENLVLTGSMGLSGTGNNLDNAIVGNGGDNILDGGDGNDTLSGGAGNDFYIVNSRTDVVAENQGNGEDTVEATVSYTLSANLEKLVLIGSTGLDGTGNALNNEIIGTSGNDTLNGGLGDDSLAGRQGNDLYFVDSTNDVVVENGGEGMDTVYSNVSYTLGANVESLFLSPSGGASQQTSHGTGNELDNYIAGDDFDGGVAFVLNGDAGNDTLIGGFFSDDTLIGGLGNDSLDGQYGDGFFMMEGGGSDTVIGNAFFSYPGGDFNYHETLSVTDQSSDALTLSAQGEDLILSFGDGDKINIRNGLNYDYHFDKYIFSDTTLTFAQLINGRSFNLSAGDDDVSFGGLPSNIAVSVFAGGGNDVVTGASGRGNSIDGGDGNDELAGISYQAADTLIGGTGNDNLISGASGATLIGGTGSDTFVLSHSLQYGSDWIGDFASMNDHIRIDQQKLPVGNGNSALDGAVSRVAPDGFAASAELVIFASDISGNITASRAAAQIGGANDAYTSGQTALFVVDNGQDSAVYYFKSAGNDALVSSSELTLLATLGGTPATNVSDYLFGS